MYVVIAGAGSVGRFMAEKLVEGGHEVVLLEQKRKRRKESLSGRANGQNTMYTVWKTI